MNSRKRPAPPSPSPSPAPLDMMEVLLFAGTHMLDELEHVRRTRPPEKFQEHVTSIAAPLGGQDNNSKFFHALDRKRQAFRMLQEVSPAEARADLAALFDRFDAILEGAHWEEEESDEGEGDSSSEGE